MAYLYWCGAAFGFGVALFFIGLGVIPTTASSLNWLKWGGAVIGLLGPIGAYVNRMRNSAVTNRSTVVLSQPDEAA